MSDQYPDYVTSEDAEYHGGDENITGDQYQDGSVRPGYYVGLHGDIQPSHHIFQAVNLRNAGYTGPMTYGQAYAVAGLRKLTGR